MSIARKPPHRCTRQAFRSTICAALVALAAPLIARTAMAQQPSVEGKPIAEVRVLDDSGRRVAIAAKLPLLPGRPFDFATERESLRVLYRTGDYADVRVTAAPEAAGLRVDFVVRRNYYNNLVHIVGLKAPPAESTALAAMRLTLGEPFRESSLRDAMARLQQALRDDGFYLAKVTPTLSAHEDTRQMDISVSVDPGPRARVGAITIENHTPYPDRILLRRSGISPRNEPTSARVSRGEQRLKQFLVNQGHLGATVRIAPGAYDSGTNHVPLAYDATAGPRVRVEITGARLRKGNLRKLLPIYAEGAVDDDLLQEGRRNIRDYFERQGYFDAQVQVTSAEKGAEREITYQVSRGERFRLEGVSFEGNRYFNSTLLDSRLQLQAASFASNGRFSQQMVRDDSDSIRSLYLANGFRGATVTSHVDDQYHGRRNRLFVTFQISEGPQTRVTSLQLQGNHALGTKELMSVVGSTPGQPYSELGVASDRNNILALYYNDGYPEARFNDQILPGGTPDAIRLVYQIVEGARIDVDRVLLTGYQYTRPGIISRQVEIQPGGPLREGDVVETQRRLYNLGVFNRVQIAPQNPQGTDPNKAVVVAVQEGQRYTVGYGVGFEVQRLAGNTSNAPSTSTTTGGNPSGTTIGASPRGILELSRSNMFGRAQTLSFKARASTLQYRGALSYTADNLGNHPSLSTALTAYADKTQDVETFTSTRYEGAYQVVQKLSPSSSLLYQYFFRRVTASDLQVAKDEIPLLSQPTLVSGFGATYARDRRDNPGDATRGTFNTADASFASTSLGSSASFFRGFFQNSSFTSFGRAFVFARSLRFGVEEPFGDTVESVSTQCTTTGVNDSLQVIPLPERFFAGGGTSIRGFGLNQAGPRDPCTGFPIGGLAMLALNQELRFPMKLPLVGNRLGGTIFYDGGNVYSDVNHMTLAWRSSSPSNLNYFSHAIGFGLRYPTPIGPVRVDFGYQLNPASYQAIDPATNLPQSFRLPHFQFFFNIGPVF